MLLLHRVLKRKTRLIDTDSRRVICLKKKPARNIRVERMTSSVSLPFLEEMPDTPLRYSDTCGTAPVHRTRRSDKYYAAVGSNDTGRFQRSISREGVSLGTACVLVLLLGCLLGTLCLTDSIHMSEVSKEVSAIRTSIDDYTRVNADLERQLAERASEVNVGYEAAQRGMISARGVDVIYLSVPENANMTFANTDDTLMSERLATILGD